ncbi:MAG: FtsX-like permease family protein [Flavobacteriaceae bacterium]
MRLALKLAFKNLWGAGTRTFLNVLVLSFSFVIIILLNSIMDGWDQQAQRDSIAWEFGQGHLIHEKYDPLDPYTILEGHGPIPNESDGLSPILVHQASIYPQGRMMGILLKGIEPQQKILELPTQKMGDASVEFPVIIGKRLAESAKLKKGDEVQIRWRDKGGTYDANTLTIMEVFDSNVPNIDNGQIWIGLKTLWKMTGYQNEASYFIADNQFKAQNLDAWRFKSQEQLLRAIKDLIAQKKAGQSIVYILLLAIALLAIFDTQILSIFRRQKEIGTYIALGMTPKKVVALFTVEGSMYSIMALVVGSIYGIPFFIYLADVGFAIPPSDQKMGLALAEVIFPVYGFKLVAGTIAFVMVSATIISFLPARKIAKLNPVLALKGKQQ